MMVAGIFNAHDPDFLKIEKITLKAGQGSPEPRYKDY
jgi:hypothetical protein